MFCFNIRDLLLRSLSIVSNVHVPIYYYYRILVLYLGQVHLNLVIFQQKLYQIDLYVMGALL
jgi:hypothetical protein